MIGETRSDLNPEQSKARIAVRDAVVTGAITLISSLITFGYPPTPEVLYMNGLTALLTGIVSYAHAVGVKTKE